METKTLRCTYCGARLKEASGETVVCPYCESVNYIRFAEKAGKDQLAEEKLKNLRARLYACVNEKYHDFEEMKNISDELLNISGYDFEAKYFYALALKKNNKRNKYIEFLTDGSNLAPNESALELVMSNIVRYAKENERTVIKKFLEINVPDPLARLEYMDNVDRQIERAARFFHGGQDVFVCHRARDGAVAESVVERLEESGITCFISERNLEDLEVGEKFEQALVKAIESTKLFLLVSSYAAFDTSSENYVLFEMEHAYRLDKPNAEFRIESIDKATERNAGVYATYFAGSQYIDAYPAPKDMLDKLCIQLKSKLDRIKAAGGERQFRDAERDEAAAKMAAEIERLKAEKTAYERKIEQLSRGEETPGNTDSEKSQKQEVDSVFGYAFAPETKAEAGDGDEYYELALDYDYARKGRPKDKAKAVYYYTKAAEAGNPLAQLNLGVCYEYGDGIKQNTRKAVALYVAASERGNAMAQCNLGYCYFNGVGVVRDAKKAVLWYEKAAAGGNVRAMNNLGYCYENGQGTKRDPEKAFSLYKAAADGGDASAAGNAAWCLESGIGTTVNLVAARKYNALAKEAGSVRAAKAYARIEEKLCACSDEAEALYEKALSFDTSERRNAAKAAALYQKAAKKGSVRAMYNLGVFCLRGDGVKKDENAAREFFEQAAARGHLAAIYNLGYCYEKGVGTEKSFAKALDNYARAADGGYTLAQYAYACLLESGGAGRQDVEKAMKYFARAAANGHEGAAARLNRDR